MARCAGSATSRARPGRSLCPRGPTRTEADGAAQIAQPRETDPDGVGLFVVDQLSTPQSETLVRLVAERSGITEDVGEKGKAGVLQAMATRAACLRDPTQRMQFVDTPKHTSWRNQIESWFRILVRRALKRGAFPSLEALRARIVAFIAYDNQTAKPFQGTYNGRPLVI